MQNTTLIKYLRKDFRLIKMVNELYGTDIPTEGVLARYREVAQSGLPHLMNVLCCTVDNKVIVVTDEKYRVSHYSLRNMVNTFLNAIRGMENNDLKDVDVYYIILDSSGEISVEPEAETHEVEFGYSTLSLANNHADVFDITYDEDQMPYALQKSKILRDYAAWALCGKHYLKENGIPYAKYEAWSEWSRRNAGSGDFEPYRFAEEGDIMHQAFEEWRMDLFIQESRNEAFGIGYEAAMQECKEEQKSIANTNQTCSVCGENVALVYVTRMENGASTRQGYCLRCARKLNDTTLNKVLEQQDWSQEDMDRIDEEVKNRLKSTGDKAVQELPESDT